MILLPTVPELIQRTKALAALDLIMSPEWEYRFYSFNSAWSPTEQMASMRDGCGDEWWIVFHSAGWAALKGLGHDSPAWAAEKDELSLAIQQALPSQLDEFSKEPAFRWDSTSFALFRLPTDSEWTSAKSLTKFADLDGGESELLSHLCGSPQDYADFTSSYYEMEIPTDIVARIFDLAPITEDMVAALNPDTLLSNIETELFEEIGYPQTDS